MFYNNPKFKHTTFDDMYDRCSFEILRNKTTRLDRVNNFNQLGKEPLSIDKTQHIFF